MIYTPSAIRSHAEEEEEEVVVSTTKSHHLFQFGDFANRDRIYIGNIPWTVGAAALKEELAGVIRELGAEPEAIEIIHFNEDGGTGGKRKKRDAAKLHRGYGFVLIKSSSTSHNDLQRLAQLAEALQGRAIAGGNRLGGIRAQVAQGIVPPPDTAEGDKDAAAVHEEGEAYRQQRRLHKRDQRRRAVERRVEMLREAIHRIRRPGGPDAAVHYQCLQLETTLLTSSSSSIDWTQVPQCLDPSVDWVKGVSLGDKPEYEVQRALLRARTSTTRTSSSSSSTRASPLVSRVPVFANEADAVQAGRKTARILVNQSDQGGNKAKGEEKIITLRGLRKRYQVESFALLLEKLLHRFQKTGDVAEHATPSPPSRRWRVVDFGSGTGNLCLPLAFLFPECDFTAVEMKNTPVEILRERASAAGLTNIRAVQSMIEGYEEPFDIALALHACGNATDYALWRAERSRAAYLVCPCCIGKLKFSIQGGSAYHTAAEHRTWRELGKNHNRPRERSTATAAATGDDDDDGGGGGYGGEEGWVRVQGVTVPKIEHPRSTWLKSSLEQCSDVVMVDEDEEDGRNMRKEQKLFAAMARAGDISHGSAQVHEEVAKCHGHEDIARLCKTHLELDRNRRMEEVGYVTWLTRLLNDDVTGKGDLLVGVPKEKMGQRGDDGWWKS